MSAAAPVPPTTAFRRLPLGAVRPGGWLADQLRLQASGLTGQLEAIWPDVGPDSAWLGGAGEDWERGPYYLDGLVPLAHVLQDGRLVERAATWVGAILASQRPDGFFGPTTNDDWWPRMVVLKVLTQHAEATDDARVVPFLQRYFAHQLQELPGRPLQNWGRWRGTENLLAVDWLHERTGEAWLLDLARLLLGQTVDWDDYLTRFEHRGVTTGPRLSTHVVNVAMGVKGPAVHQLFSPDGSHRRALEEGLANLDRYHGQVHGMFSGDEHLAGTAATRGVELCAVVEMMFSLQESLRVWGDVGLADRLERIAYNLLPAGTNAEVTAHQYHQQANQVRVDVAPREWTAADDDCTIFGLEPNFGCCTANLHQGWPKLLQAMWMATEDGGLAAVVHGPSQVVHSDARGTLALTAATDYPFADSITYTVTTAEPSLERTLRFRVPRWCPEPRLVVGGEVLDTDLVDGYLVVRRPWRSGDTVELRLPARPRLNPRPSGAVGVDLGPLVLVHAPGEIWERIPGSPHFGDWEVRARSGWNVGLAVDEAIVAAAPVDRSSPEAVPFALRSGRPERRVEGPPLRVWLPGAKVAGWTLHANSAAEPPRTDQQATLRHTLPLVPYGSARIRVAEFPLLTPVESSGWDS